jgi:two-component system sensor histidine kinase DegS
MIKNVDIGTLDKIVKKTISSIRDSRGQIYDVYEMARDELETVKRDVERIKQETAAVIKKVDELERNERKARIHLMEVSRDFKNRTEEEVREAYEDARKIQIDVAVTREQEQNLRRQRDEMEVRLRNLGGTVAKAEQLVSQVGVVLDYLGNQMSEAFSQIESLQNAHELGAQVIRSQEEERRRVSREIHDGPAQAMANIVFRAEVCERLMESDVARAKHELGDLREQVRIALKETRKIIFDLRPMTLDDLGLVPTIRKVLETIKERSAVFSEVKVLGTEKRLEPHIEIGLFRIIQEALSNVEKHAKASNIWVRIDFRPSVVSAVVEDDGRGFDTVESVGNESFGLMGMRERINLLRGELTIKSEVGKGTRVFVTVPLGP